MWTYWRRPDVLTHDPQVMNFTIKEDGFENIITMHFFSLQLHGSRGYLLHADYMVILALPIDMKP